jgi:hypothetical protein
LPAPLGPTIRVKGLKKVMTFLFSGSKLRMPLINILSTVLIFLLPYNFLFNYFRMECEIGGADDKHNKHQSVAGSVGVGDGEEEGKNECYFLSQSFMKTIQKNKNKKL